VRTIASFGPYWNFILIDVLMMIIHKRVWIYFDERGSIVLSFIDSYKNCVFEIQITKSTKTVMLEFSKEALMNHGH